MIRTTPYSVFDSNCEIIVNTINCLGVMRAGIALEFSLRYPKMLDEYTSDCQRSIIKTGKTYLYNCEGQKILGFPTKNDYLLPSKIEYIENGLKYFAQHYQEYNAKSVAFPLLGCTNGQLSYKEQVEPLIYRYLSQIDMDIYICLNTELHPNGLERRMLDEIKRTDIDQLVKDLCIDSQLAQVIRQNVQAVDRLGDLAISKRVGGVDNYIKIWNYIYSKI